MFSEALLEELQITTIAHNHIDIMMETIRPRRLVTVWYLEGNLMAMKRSALIKVR